MFVDSIILTDFNSNCKNDTYESSFQLICKFFQMNHEWTILEYDRVRDKAEENISKVIIRNQPLLDHSVLCFRWDFHEMKRWNVSVYH